MAVSAVAKDSSRQVWASIWRESAMALIFLKAALMPMTGIFFTAELDRGRELFGGACFPCLMDSPAN